MQIHAFLNLHDGTQQEIVNADLGFLTLKIFFMHKKM